MFYLQKITKGLIAAAILERPINSHLAIISLNHSSHPKWCCMNYKIGESCINGSLNHSYTRFLEGMSIYLTYHDIIWDASIPNIMYICVRMSVCYYMIITNHLYNDSNHIPLKYSSYQPRDCEITSTPTFEVQCLRNKHRRNAVKRRGFNGRITMS